MKKVGKQHLAVDQAHGAKLHHGCQRGRAAAVCTGCVAEAAEAAGTGLMPPPWLPLPVGFAARA